MKIEIGESLVYSWLRHVKYCQIVQTNWKPSPIWRRQDVNLDHVADAIKNQFRDLDLDIFRNNTHTQFLRQAEVDVLGVSDEYNDQGPIYYLVDVAYHEDGLNYGDTSKTIANVLKKIIRSYFIFKYYFCESENAQISFVSPKASVNNLEVPLQEKLTTLVSVFQSFHMYPDFQIIMNDRFKDEILKPTLEILGKISDTNELFIRSAQLMKLFDADPHNTHQVRAERPRPRQRNIRVHEEFGQGEESNQDFIRNRMQSLILGGRLTRHAIQTLQDSQFCREEFRLSFPLLRYYEQGRVDENNYPRYYTRPLVIGETEFWLCSQWYPTQRGLFQQWYDRLMIIE